MKKKGFTLVELMAVIILLGVIALIAYPTVTNTINSSKEKAYEETIRQIEQAASRYGMDNDNILPKIDGIFDATIKLQDLVKAGYIKKTEGGKLYNPIDNSEMTGCIDIKYDTEYSQYIYTYDSECASQEIIEYANYYVNYGGKYIDQFVEGIQTSDGGYVAIGNTNSPKVRDVITTSQDVINNDALIVKFDSKGQVEWENTFGGTSIDAFMEVIEVVENGKKYYIVVGYSFSSDYDMNNTNNVEVKSIAIKYDELGNVILTKIFDEYVELFGIEKTDSGFVFIGEYISSTANGEIFNKLVNEYTCGNVDSSVGILFETDSNFNVKWSTAIGETGSNVFYDVLKTETGYITVGYLRACAGTWVCKDSDAWRYDAAIVLVDKNGNITNKALFGSSASDYFYKVAIVDDGYVAVGSAGATDIDLANDSKIGGVIVKFDKNLNEIKHIILNNKVSDIINDGNNLLVTSGINDKNLYTDGVVTKLDFNLNIISNVAFNGENLDSINSVEKTSDGYVVFGGTYSKGKDFYDVTDPYLFGHQDAIILKYDKSLNLKKDFEKIIVLSDQPKELVKNYGTTIPTYQNIESLELYTTNDPTKNLKNWNVHYLGYGPKDNYKYARSLVPFNSNDIVSMLSNSFLKYSLNEYIMDINLDKIDVANSWFQLHLVYYYDTTDFKLIFNGQKYTLRECVDLGLIEPLVLHGSASSNVTLVNQNSEAILDGTFYTGPGNTDTYVVFKTKAPGFQGVTLNFPDSSSYQHNRKVTINGLRNFDISLTKSE